MQVIRILKLTGEEWYAVNIKKAEKVVILSHNNEILSLFQQRKFGKN